MALFTCPDHDFPIEAGNLDGCPACLERTLNGPHPLTMTPDERVAEMTRLVDPLTCRVSAVMGRLSELVGREILTHEVGARWDALLDEARARTGEVPIDDIIGSLEARGTEVIVVDPDGGSR